MINLFLAICKFINNLAAFPAILVVRGKNKTDWGDDELKFAGQKKNRRRRGEIRHCRWQCKIFANGGVKFLTNLMSEETFAWRPFQKQIIGRQMSHLIGHSYWKCLPKGLTKYLVGQNYWIGLGQWWPTTFSSSNWETTDKKNRDLFNPGKNC